jgi:hypothetical protein
MKHDKKIISGFLAMFVLGMTSCLKDSFNNSDPAKSNSVVQFQNSSIPVSYTSIFAQYDNGVFLAGDTGNFNINISYTGSATAAPQNISVSLALSQSALDSFNNDQGTSYILPPTDVFTFPATATIPKGSTQVTVHAHITAAADLNYSASYALPLRITSTSYGILSTNFGTAIYSFVVNNQYAGDYTATGYIFHPSAPRALKATYSVGTAGSSTNTFPFGDLASSGYVFKADVPSGGGALSNYVPISSMPKGTASGFMTLDNPGGTDYSSAAPQAPGTAPWLSSTYNNSYDAANKTFWLHVGYASGGNGQNTFTRQMYEKLVKQ